MGTGKLGLPAVWGHPAIHPSDRSRAGQFGVAGHRPAGFGLAMAQPDQGGPNAHHGSRRSAYCTDPAFTPEHTIKAHLRPGGISTPPHIAKPFTTGESRMWRRCGLRFDEKAGDIT